MFLQMQIIDMIAREPSREMRNNILATAVGGGNRNDIPGCSPDEIALAVGGLIDDMERMEEVSTIRQ